MTPKFWMITNRNRDGKVLGSKRDTLSFYIGDKAMPTSDAKVSDMTPYWKNVTASDFRKKLQEAADGFPVVPETAHEKQKHVTVFIHGYNTTWDEAARRYQDIVRRLYTGEDSLGTCILFNWPSNGKAVGCLPDRGDARDTARDLSDVFNTLDEQAALMQRKRRRLRPRDEFRCQAFRKTPPRPLRPRPDRAETGQRPRLRLQQALHHQRKQHPQRLLLDPHHHRTHAPDPPRTRPRYRRPWCGGCLKTYPSKQPNL